MDWTPERLEAARTWYLQAVDALDADGWRRPSLCAGWEAAHVVAHVTGGDRYFRALALDATGRDPSVLAALPTSMEERAKQADAMGAWEHPRLREATRTESEQTVRVLRDVVERAPGTKLRMPFGEVPVTNAMVIRTMEYIIHGHDLEPAIGRSRPIPPWYVDLALPHAMQNMIRTHPRSPHKGNAASFHFHRTDADGEWTLRAEDGQARSNPGHDHADVALRGPGEALYWVLMGRGRADEHGVEVFGDAALAVALKEWFPGP